MREVTEQEFYAALRSNQRDIMPTIDSGWSNADGYASTWHTTDLRRVVFGRSTGGGTDKARYWLADIEAAEVRQI
jgi:hypothetical protein